MEWVSVSFDSAADVIPRLAIARVRRASEPAPNAGSVHAAAGDSGRVGRHSERDPFADSRRESPRCRSPAMERRVEVESVAVAVILCCRCRGLRCVNRADPERRLWARPRKRSAGRSVHGCQRRSAARLEAPPTACVRRPRFSTHGRRFRYRRPRRRRVVVRARWARRHRRICRVQGIAVAPPAPCAVADLVARWTTNDLTTTARTAIQSVIPHPECARWNVGNHGS
jgi:hypothetical protein